MLVLFTLCSLCLLVWGMILAGGGGDPSFAFLHIYVGALNVLNWSPAALWEWTQASVGRWVLATGMTSGGRWFYFYFV